MFTDEELNELLEFISGEGKFRHFGKGIHTYPNRDENNKKIFAACIELEKRGLVYRSIDEPEYVFFKRRETADGGR